MSPSDGANKLLFFFRFLFLGEKRESSRVLSFSLKTMMFRSSSVARMRAFPQSGSGCLSAEAVEGASLPLEGIDDVHGRDGLAPRVLRVGDRVADHVLEEHLEDAARLLIDGAADTLDTSTASKTADRRLGNALDIVSQHLAVTLGSALAEPLSSLSTSCHCLSLVCSLITLAAFPLSRPM